MNISVRVVVASLALMLVTGCSSGGEHRDFGKIRGGAAVSMVRILAAPEAFDGKQVQVIGVIHLEFEGDRLCLDSGSAIHFVFENCLTLEFSEALEVEYQMISRLNDRYVLVEATFEDNDLCEGCTCVGCLAGNLVSASRLVVWED